jgi:hypothetical protein
VLLLAGAWVPGYSLLVSKRFPDGGSGINQWQENIIRLERFAFSSRRYRCIIAGSSMASRIRQELVGPDDYNLSASGRSALVGLDAVLKSRSKPACVLIEANWTLLQNEDGPEGGRVFSPLPRLLKSLLPGLREVYQPVTLIAGMLKSRREAEKPDVVDVNFESHLSANLANENVEPAPGPLHLKVARLAAAVKALEEGGTRVFFFDPPRHKWLMEGARSRGVRAAIRAQIPSVPWLEADEGVYETEDGIHLTGSSAGRYSRLLGSRLAGLPAGHSGE